MRAAAAVLLAFAFAFGCRDGPSSPTPREPQPLATFFTEAGEIAVAVEVARDPAARATGLMRREELAPFAGMVFVFPAQAEHPFWMKNTLIPLDMIFIDEELVVVGVIENAEPLTLAMRTVSVPSRYVVEVSGGFATEHAITVGTRVAFEHVL